MKGEKGFALVMALVVTALLVALLVEFVNEVYVDTSHSHNFVAAQQAGILAESGIEGGIKLLQVCSAMRHEPYSSLLEPWAKPLSFSSENGSVTITIEEESGKLNLNMSTTANGTPNDYTEIAARLFENLKISKDLTEVLLDWVDENDYPHLNGADVAYYSNLKPPYSCKNKKLETVEELSLLRDFLPDVMTKLRPSVTVYESVENEPLTKVNVNTAPRDLLVALGLGEDKVDRILDVRKSRPIKSLADFDISPGVQARLTCLGSVYRIRAEGKVGESIAVAEAVVRTIGGTAQPTVLYWREY